MIAEEAFYRAGGIAAAQAILDPTLMLHESATRATELERETGRAEAVISRYSVGQGDVMVIVSNSGRNAYPIEMAMAARERGATTIALTSLRHSTKTAARHPSGKRLFEITDHVIDNGAEYGDSALSIPARTVSMGPTSTIMGVFILNALLAEAVGELAQQGVMIDVYQSSNRQDQGSTDATDAIIARWRDRIVGL